MGFFKKQQTFGSEFATRTDVQQYLGTISPLERDVIETSQELSAADEMPTQESVWGVMTAWMPTERFDGLRAPRLQDTLPGFLIVTNCRISFCPGVLSPDYLFQTWAGGIRVTDCDSQQGVTLVRFQMVSPSHILAGDVIKGLIGHDYLGSLAFLIGVPQDRKSFPAHLAALRRFEALSPAVE